VSLLAVDPNKLFRTSLKGIATCPREIFNSKAINNSKASIENKIVFLVWNIILRF
jgi:hypothetical protein